MNEWLGNIGALWLTLKLALMTTLILLLLCIPLCWWLAKYRGVAKPLLEAIIALPLVLPPTVLGFYLLIAFSPQSLLGKLWITATGEQLVFSFSGILFGSLLYSLPFVAQPLLAAFSQQGDKFDDVAASLGINPIRRFLFLTLPMLRPALVSAMVLGFAHTIGEFGLVLMIGGNIPGETQVLSIALYDHVEALDYQSAHQMAALLVIISFSCLALLFKFNKPRLSFGV